MNTPHPLSALEAAHRLAPRFGLIRHQAQMLGEVLASGDAGLGGVKNNKTKVKICQLRKKLGNTLLIVSEYPGGRHAFGRGGTKECRYVLDAAARATAYKLAAQSPPRPPFNWYLSATEEGLFAALIDAKPIESPSWAIMGLRQKSGLTIERGRLTPSDRARLAALGLFARPPLTR